MLGAASCWTVDVDVAKVLRGAGETGWVEAAVEVDDEEGVEVRRGDEC